MYAQHGHCVGASLFTRAKLRVVFEIYERTMDPVHHTPSSESLFCLKSRLHVQLVRAAAKGLWGEGQWLNECKKLFSWSMKTFVTDQRGWDAYVIGIISITILKHLLPDNVRGNDAACEMHRWFFLYAFTAFACCALWVVVG